MGNAPYTNKVDTNVTPCKCVLEANRSMPAFFIHPKVKVVDPARSEVKIFAKIVAEFSYSGIWWVLPLRSNPTYNNYIVGYVDRNKNISKYLVYHCRQSAHLVSSSGEA